MQVIGVLVAALLELLAAGPGSQETGRVCGERFPTLSCLQFDHQTDARTPVAGKGAGRESLHINSSGLSESPMNTKCIKVHKILDLIKGVKGLKDC